MKKLIATVIALTVIAAGASFVLPLLVIISLGGGAAAASACLADPAAAFGDYVPSSQGAAENADYIWSTLRDAGISPVGAAAVMGTLQAESGFDPKAKEIRNGQLGPGRGIAQWGDHGGDQGSDRWNLKVQPWAHSQTPPLDEWKLETQVQWLIHEMKTYPSPQGRAGGNLFEYLRTVSDISAASRNYQLIYEGYTADVEQRQGYSRALLAKYASKPLTPGFLTPSSPGGSIFAAATAQPRIAPAAAVAQPRIAPAVVATPAVAPLAGATSPPLRKVVVGSGMYYAKGGAHFAYDLQAETGTPVYAVADGVIIDANDGVKNDGVHGQGSPSNWITLGVIYQGRKATVYYQHLSPGLSVRKGQHVKAGSLIAHSGYTGNVEPPSSLGAHLHIATEWGWKTDSNRYDYLNHGPNGADLIFPPSQVWKTSAGTQQAAFNDVTSGGSVFIVGDSLSNTRDGAGQHVKGIYADRAKGVTVTVNAQDGRSTDEGIQVLQSDPQAAAASVWVVALGTNDAGTKKAYAAKIAKVTQLAAGKTVYWLTVVRPDSSALGSAAGVNAAIKAAAVSNIKMIDFQTQAAAHPEYFAGDGIHMTSAGYAWRAQMYLVDDATPADLGTDFGSAACQGGSTTPSPGQTDVAPDKCPTTAPPGTIRDGATKLGVLGLCQKSVREARTPEAARAIMFAFANLGKPYGGDIRATTGFDCSSLLARGFVAGGVKQFFSALPSTTEYANAPDFLKRTKTPQAGDINIMWKSNLTMATSFEQSGHAQMWLSDGFIIQSGGSASEDNHVNVSKAPSWPGWTQQQFAYMPAADA